MTIPDSDLLFLGHPVYRLIKDQRNNS